MKKHLISLTLFFFVIITISAEMYRFFPSNIKKYHIDVTKQNVSDLDCILCDTIKFVLDSKSTREFKYDIPDTIWIKHKKKPKEGKDFRKMEYYKGVEEESKSLFSNKPYFYSFSPKDSIEKTSFIVDSIGVKYSSYSYHQPEQLYFYLRDVNNNRRVIFTPEEYRRTKIIPSHAIHELSSTLIGGSFYKKSGYGLNEFEHMKATSIDYYITLYSKCYYHSYIQILFKNDNNETYDYNNEYVNKTEIYNQLEYNNYVENKNKKDSIWKRDAGYYCFELKKVEKSSNRKTLSANNNYWFDDENIKIFWYFEDTYFKFNITNESNQTMQILWDDISIVNIDNTSSKAFHSGIKYINRNEHQIPTSIPKGAEYSDLLMPIDNVYYSTYSGEWKERDLIPKSLKSKVDGTTMKVVMPFKIGNRKYEYTFIFNVEWVWLHPELRK